MARANEHGYASPIETAPPKSPRSLRWIPLSIIGVVIIVVLVVAFWPRKDERPPDFSAFQASLAAIKKDLRPNQAYVNCSIDALAKPENKEALRAAVKTERDTFGLLIVVGAIAKLDDRGAAPMLVDRLIEMKSNRDAYPAGANIATLLGAWKVPEAVAPLVDLPEFYFPHGAEPPLLELGPGAARALLDATAKPDDPRRFPADGLIARTRDPGAKEALLAAAKTGRRSAVQALGNYPSAEVEEALAAISDGADAALADAAAFSLVKIDPDRHLLRLLPILRAGEAERAIAACRIAASRHVTGAVPALRELLKSPSQSVQFAVLEALAELEGDVLTAAANADGSWTVEGGETTLRLTDAATVEELVHRAEKSP